RRPRPLRLLLPGQLVDLARHLDPGQDDPRRARPARRLLITGETAGAPFPRRWAHTTARATPGPSPGFAANSFRVTKVAILDVGRPRSGGPPTWTEGVRAYSVRSSAWLLTCRPELAGKPAVRRVAFFECCVEGCRGETCVTG